MCYQFGKSISNIINFISHNPHGRFEPNLVHKSSLRPEISLGLLPTELSSTLKWITIVLLICVNVAKK